MTDIQTTAGNPFAGQDTKPSQLESTAQREASEVQAMMIVAKQFPRDAEKAMDRILNACTRPSLARGALYSYQKGGSEITGPSIRMAEAIAQQWGNMQFGIRELEQGRGESKVEAFAWDIETNTRQVKVFTVPHLRFTKKGSYRLEDPREVYELVANQGARRLRACILGVIPGDVVDAATKQVETTLATQFEITPDYIRNMLSAFKKIKVSKEMVEKFIQRRVDSMTPALAVRLDSVFNSIKDGMSAVGDWFDTDDGQDSAGAAKSGAAGLADNLNLEG